MKKAWIVFLLVLLISTQFAALSLFHEVDRAGFATGVSVITIAKFDYVDASLELSVSPVVAENGSTTSVNLTMPNGTNISVKTSPYSVTILLPRTGDFFGNGGVSGPVAVSESDPMNVSISQNVGDVAQYEASMNASASILQIQSYFVVVYGDASVLVDGFGVAL